jgi:hypothetical protein
MIWQVLIERLGKVQHTFPTKKMRDEIRNYIEGLGFRNPFSLANEGKW